jgi:hypothetical protein
LANSLIYILGNAGAVPEPESGELLLFTAAKLWPDLRMARPLHGIQCSQEQWQIRLSKRQLEV